jgi:hypothetical protein
MENGLKLFLKPTIIKAIEKGKLIERLGRKAKGPYFL